MTLSPKQIVTFFEIRLSGAQLSREDTGALTGLEDVSGAALRGQTEDITEPPIAVVMAELSGDLPPLPSGMWEPFPLIFTTVRYSGNWWKLPGRYVQIDTNVNLRSGPSAAENTALSNSYQGYLTKITPQQHTRGATPRKLQVEMMVGPLGKPDRSGQRRQCQGLHRPCESDCELWWH